MHKQRVTPLLRRTSKSTRVSAISCHGTPQSKSLGYKAVSNRKMPWYAPGSREILFLPTHSTAGSFDGEYNRLYLVTDCADQVASIQLVCENPTRSGSGASTDWYCYNFVNYRVKALPRLGISHQVGLENNGSLLRIESVLIDSKGRPAEAVRWFLPKLRAELILFCISNSEHRP